MEPREAAQTQHSSRHSHELGTVEPTTRGELLFRFSRQHLPRPTYVGLGVTIGANSQITPAKTAEKTSDCRSVGVHVTDLRYQSQSTDVYKKFTAHLCQNAVAFSALALQHAVKQYQ